MKSGNGFKLNENRFRLDITKKLLTVRMMRHWHRGPRKAADAPSTFKERLNGDLSDLV